MKLLACLAVCVPIALPFGTRLTGPARPHVEPATYEVDSDHSLVVFKIRHLGVANFYGTFKRVSGQFRYDEAAPENSSVKVEVDVDSVDANNPERHKLLVGEGFFDAAKHPTWTFESTEVAKAADDQFTLKGELVVRGQKKEIEAELELIGAGRTFMGQRAGWEARFTIDRSEFGMTQVPPPGLGNEIEVIVSLEGVKR